MSKIFLPNGYMQDKVRILPGLYLQETIADQWDAIVTSGRGMVIESTLQTAIDTNRKQGIILHISPLGTLRLQWERMTGKRLNPNWDATKLMDEIETIQSDSLPQAVEPDSDMHYAAAVTSSSSWADVTPDAPVIQTPKPKRKPKRK